ncbi:MAG: DUF4832 domain-containing protein [Prevotella sp.]|nr:DUF4832 domain-containing protein [Prevotella sp.]
MKSIRLFILSAAVTFTLTANAGSRQRSVSFTADTVRVLRNPLTGWVMYLGRNWDDQTYTRMHYDSMPTSEGGTANVADYATTCYLRTSWASMEPEEGRYFWNDPQSRLYKLLQSMRARGLRLAFRIVVDARDQGQNTPLYVRNAGAKGFCDPHNPKIWSPYPDDAVFQAKYAKFLKAFAQKFNDINIVSFIDAYGLGKWGEAHGVKYADYANKHKVFDWITSLYQHTFTNVPLIINYHRLVGDTISWAAPAADSDSLLCSAIAKGYSLRHDAFGMTDYYQQWERDFAARFRFRRPIIMEGGWITGGHHRYWRDSSGRYREGHSEDVRAGEMADAHEAHANMMDFRIGDETVSWFGKAFNLVKQFNAHGGYRLYPSSISFYSKVKAGEPLHVVSVWNNIGWGYCPTNIPQWHQKYKIGYALRDGQGRIVKRWTDNRSDLSTWLQGQPVSNAAALPTQGLAKGRYRLLTALIDVSNGDPALEMAVSKQLLNNGWLEVGQLTLTK